MTLTKVIHIRFGVNCKAALQTHNHHCNCKPCILNRKCRCFRYFAMGWAKTCSKINHLYTIYSINIIETEVEKALKENRGAFDSDKRFIYEIQCKTAADIL